MKHGLEFQSKQQERLLIFLDLNRFKYINDALSHMTGDQLLIDVSVAYQTIYKTR